MESYSRANLMPSFRHSQTLTIDLGSSFAHFGDSFCDLIEGRLPGMV